LRARGWKLEPRCEALKKRCFARRRWPVIFAWSGARFSRLNHEITPAPTVVRHVAAPFRTQFRRCFLGTHISRPKSHLVKQTLTSPSPSPPSPAPSVPPFPYPIIS
ncbi:unnamed protein product, partial [Scytosiphon promiscuus]